MPRYSYLNLIEKNIAAKMQHIPPSSSVYGAPMLCASAPASRLPNGAMPPNDNV